MSKESILSKLRADVQTFGWHCLSVYPRKGEEGAAFTYTIGLGATFEHPEIMIFGLDREVSHGILQDCVQMIRDGARFLPDTEYSKVIGGTYKVVFKRVRPECLPEYFGAAARYYAGRPFSGLILFWPDKVHRFPWQEASSTAQREAMNLVEPHDQADASVPAALRQGRD